MVDLFDGGGPRRGDGRVSRSRPGRTILSRCNSCPNSSDGVSCSSARHVGETANRSHHGFKALVTDTQREQKRRPRHVMRRAGPALSDVLVAARAYGRVLKPV